MTGAAIAILFDVLTLPIRIVTTPIKFVYDLRNPKQPHPLSQLLEKENKQPFSDESVIVHYIIEEVEIEYQNAHKETIDGAALVYLRHLYTTNHPCIEKVTSSSYSGKNEGDWVLECEMSALSSRYRRPYEVSNLIDLLKYTYFPFPVDPLWVSVKRVCGCQ